MKISHKLHFTLAVALAACASAAALPEGYTEVEYVASSGTQYIDTGVIPKSTTRLVCDFRLTGIPSARFRCGWGAAASKESLYFQNSEDLSQFAACVSSDNVQALTGVAVDMNRHVFDLAKGSLKFDGSIFSTEATLNDDALSGTDRAGNSKTMYLFAQHQGWSTPPVGNYGALEIYSCRIYDGTALVRDFVPAVRVANGEAGLYDCVTDAFFGNLGTGAFTAGEVAHAALADGYTELEYIYMEGGASFGQQNDTATHYINTGVVPSGDWSVKAEFASTNTLADNTVYSALFCARHNGSANNMDAFMFWPHTGTTGRLGEARVDVGALQTPSSSFLNGMAQAAISQRARHTVAIKRSGSGKIAGYFDGVRVTEEVAQFGSSICPLYLFSAYTGASDGSRSNVKFSFEGWFYSLTADNASGGRRLDLVPARRDADGAVGLYERVSETFLTNQGPGSFVAGPEKRGDYYVGVEYIESNGSQYIDTLWTNGSSHVVTLDIQPTVLPSSTSATDPNGSQSYYGCRNAAAERNIVVGADAYNNHELVLDFNNGSYNTYRLIARDVSASYRYVAVNSAAQRTLTWYDAGGAVVSSITDSDSWTTAFSCAGSAYLFAANDMSGGSPAILWNKAKMKFYGGTVKTAGGTPCCDLVPCLKNGVEPGVYDTVRCVFLPNAGSGTFAYGAETGDIYGQVSKDNDFVVSPIPVQFAATSAALQSGIEPSVTVSNLADRVGLILGTDYTVTYLNNTAIGTAYATVTGVGDYEGKSAVVAFTIDCDLDPSNYDHTMTISPTLGKVTSALTNFPALVRLSTARQPWFDPADCAANGADLRFTLSDGTLLAHEIDTWNPAGESIVWVNVPELTASTVVNAYWGAKNASFVPIVNPADTWPDFVAVYHLGEGGATARDSSANGYDAVNKAAVSLGANAPVGRCASITDLYATDVWSLVNPNAAKPLADRSRVTLSGWVAFDGNGANQNACITIGRLYHGWNTSNGGFDCRYFEAYPYFGLVLNSGGGYSQENWNTTTPSKSNGNWIYLTCTVDGAKSVKYFNGNLLEAKTLSHGILGPDLAGYYYSFGASTAIGRMDEVRLRDGVASTAWMAADYAQQISDDFLAYATVVDEAFTVSPIPNQTVSFAELQNGVTPSVTVSNLTAGTELVLGTDYSVFYRDNTLPGVAFAVVVGCGDYAAYTNTAPFLITGVAEYFIVGGTEYESAGSSSLNGDGSPTGWSTTKGGYKSVGGITAGNAVYYVWTTRSIRTPYARNYATPANSAIVVEPSCNWNLGVKMTGQTLTLNNVLIRAGGAVIVTPINDDGGVQNNTFAGSFTLEEGATLRLDARQNPTAIKQSILSARVAGRGAIVMPSSSDTIAYSGTLENKITGDITGFTGDIGTWRGNDLAAVSLELVNAVSLPGDPAPEEIAYVVVTNGATLKIDQDWTSPTNRIWILGDAGTPTIEVAADKTVEIDADLVGSAGFIKTGAGTLVLRGASPDFSGEITILAGTVRLVGKAALLSGAADVTITEAGGRIEVAALSISPIPAQTVNSLAVLAAGITPSVTVSNLETSTELILGTDYTIAYFDNKAYGVATVVATGAGDYAGMVQNAHFIIHLEKVVDADYNLSANEDWTDFESVTVVSGVVIDLKGHNLTISGLNGSGTITDSVGGGELHYAVPATFESGYEAKIENVSLTGGLKLVKDGPGTLTTIKQKQTFTGGTEIAAGLLRYGCSDKGINNTYPFGWRSSTEMGPVTIDAGGILELAGSGGWGNHSVVINGGIISNTVASATAWSFNPKMTVNADFTFATTQNYRWFSPGFDLNGHTVTIGIGIGKIFEFSSPISNGVLDIVSGGYIKTASAIASPTLDIRSNCALYMDNAWSVRDYTPIFPSNYGMGTAALNVSGTFTPDSAYFYGPTMQDGSAIDLSAKTGAWNVKSSLNRDGGNAVTRFVPGATVAILLGERTLAQNARVVSWAAADAPDATVAFTNDTYVLRTDAKGLYVDSRRDFTPTDIPDLAEARTSADIAAAIESALTMTDLTTDETLVLGENYSYTYTIDNGVCTVTVTGLGDYAGLSVTRSFSIGLRVKPSAFAYSMEIRPSAGKLETTLTNFPVLVRLSADIDGFSYSKCRASELRFALPDGTMLAHEIDWWNENGESTVWVNLPVLDSNTVFRAYWGLLQGREALGIASVETWPEYVGVWHFSEASGIAHDSSGNGYDSIDNGGGTLSNQNAKVGLARNANNTSMITSVTKLDSTSAAKPMTTMSKFSVSGWMYSNADVATSSKKYPQQIRNKNGWNESTGWYTGIEGASDKFCGNGSGGTRTIIKLPVSIYTNWVYLTTIFNDRSCSVYANGAFVTNTPIDTVKASTTYPLRFATDFNGIMDEYRIHDRIEAAAYIGADYATQTDPAFLTFGKVNNTAPTMLILR